MESDGDAISELSETNGEFWHKSVSNLIVYLVDTIMNRYNTQLRSLL